jgi:hypothetical protein
MMNRQNKLECLSLVNFSAWSNILGQGQEPTLEASRLWPYFQILDKDEKVCNGQMN